MILDATDDHSLEALSVGDASHVGPEFRLEFFGDGFLTTLRAEDDVNAIAGIGVRHCAVPLGLVPFITSLPSAEALG